MDPYAPILNYQFMIRASVDEAGNIVALDLPTEPQYQKIVAKMLRAACEVMGVETGRKIKFREFI